MQAPVEQHQRGGGGQRGDSGGGVHGVGGGLLATGAHVVGIEVAAGGVLVIVGFAVRQERDLRGGLERRRLLFHRAAERR